MSPVYHDRVRIIGKLTMKTSQTLTCLLLLVAAQAATAGSPQTLAGRDLEPVSQEDVKPLVAVCESCHGPGGHSERDDVPVLAGKPAKEILDALEQFYYYERHCPRVEYQNKKGETVAQSMCDITNALTKPEADALGSYFEASATVE